MTRRFLLLALLALLLLSAGCATAPTQDRGNDADLNPTLGPSSYIEDGNLLTLIVGTRAAKSRAKYDYVPVEIALAIKGIPGITLTRESFTLVDAGGNRYPAVGPDELRGNYPNVDLDRRLGEILTLANGRFQAHSRIRSNWSPGFRDSIELPRLYLPRFNWAYDFLYFPKPESGVRGQKFELHITAPELPHPILIKFRVR